MHDEEFDIDVSLVRALIDSQFPWFSGLELRVVTPWGTDNAVWRLGDELVVRVPRIGWARGQPGRDHRVLPRIARHVDVPIPEPVALGQPGLGYPYKWSVHRWIDGCSAELGAMRDPIDFAGDLAQVVGQLHTAPVVGAPPPRNRGRPLATYDADARWAIDSARHLIDADAALAVWADALAAPAYVGPDVWVHGDLEGNCLLDDGRLCGIVDWGSACRGDPAVDVQVVWSPLFNDRSRQTFLDALEVDDATLRRSRGAAVQQACAALPYYLDTYPEIVARSRHKLAQLGIGSR